MPGQPRSQRSTHLMCRRMDVALLAHDDVGQVLVLPGRCWGGLDQEPAGGGRRRQALELGGSTLPQPVGAYRLIFLELGFRPVPPHSPQPGSTKFTAWGFASRSALLFSRWKSATTSSPAKASVITPRWSMPPSCGDRGQCPAASWLLAQEDWARPAHLLLHDHG